MAVADHARLQDMQGAPRFSLLCLEMHACLARPEGSVWLQTPGREGPMFVLGLLADDICCELRTGGYEHSGSRELHSTLWQLQVI